MITPRPSTRAIERDSIKSVEAAFTEALDELICDRVNHGPALILHAQSVRRQVCELLGIGGAEYRPPAPPVDGSSVPEILSAARRIAGAEIVKRVLVYLGCPPEELQLDGVRRQRFLRGGGDLPGTGYAMDIAEVAIDGVMVSATRHRALTVAEREQVEAEGDVDEGPPYRSMHVPAAEEPT